MKPEIGDKVRFRKKPYTLIHFAAYRLQGKSVEEATYLVGGKVPLSYWETGTVGNVWLFRDEWCVTVILEGGRRELLYGQFGDEIEVIG